MTTPLCILLVDDSEFFLTLEKQFLKHTPATILTAQSAGQALALAREHQPSLVYMDMDMPGTDGVDCCRQFKADPALCQVPIILIGEKAQPEDRERSEESGADAYLEKPIDRRRFLEVGHSFLFSIDRREPRKNVKVSVKMTCLGHVSIVDGIDLSTGGMFVACETGAGQGEPLLLQFDLPGSESVKVSLKGRVAWVNVAGKGRKPDYPDGYGVEFMDIPENVGVALRRYIGQQTSTVCEEL